MMTCRECVEKLHPYLDRELSEAEQAEVEGHLARCGPCADVFHFEAGILRTVHRCCHSTVASDGLKARVRVVIRAALVGEG